MSSLLPGDPVRTLSQFVHDAVERVGQALRPEKEEHEPLPTVENVDPERYAGLWYELARLPLRFQADDTLSTAEYTVQDDGSIRVHNTSYDGEEVSHEISGVATAAEGAEDSFDRLKVQFGGFLKLVPTDDEGNYWIIKLADDYSMAMVGTPDRDSLWLLVRDTSDLDTGMIQSYIETAHGLGFDTAKLLVADWDKHQMLASGPA